MSGLINWDKLTELVQDQDQDKSDPEEVWGQFDHMYDKMSRLERDYTKNQIDQIELTGDEVVLDICCGTGRLSIPLAKKAKKVISIDVSKNMLSYAKKYAEEEGVDNIEFHHMDWDDVTTDTFEDVDIAVTSRSCALGDIEKVSSLAKDRVYMLSFANGPSLREIQLDFFKGIEGNTQFTSNFNRVLGYNIQFNRVYDLGYDPSLVVVEDGFTRDYDSREDAYGDLIGLGHVEDDDMDKFHANVDRYLLDLEDGRQRFLRKTSTYVMWWDV